MSGYDLGVWFSDVAISREQAADFLQHVLADWVVVQRHPSFDAFWTELLASFPDTGTGSDRLADLDSPPISMLLGVGEVRSAGQAGSGYANPPVRSLDDTVWAEGPLSAHGCVALLSVAWSRAGEVVPQILGLAGRHGLMAYDIQSGDIASPPGLDQGVGLESAHLRLEVAGDAPALDIRILLDGRPMASFAAVSRSEAHSRARSVALEQALPLYEVTDPGSLAQRFAPRQKPISADDPDLDPVGKFLVGFERAPGFPPKPE